MVSVMQDFCPEVKGLARSCEKGRFMKSYCIVEIQEGQDQSLTQSYSCSCKVFRDNMVTSKRQASVFSFCFCGDMY